MDLKFPLHFAEERLDALPDRPAAVIRELLLRAGPEAPAIPSRPLVVHLAEDEIEELPERSVLRHAFVAVDEVVAAAERGAQHLRVGPSRPRPRQHVAVIDGLVDRRPVADRFGVHLELRRLPAKKEELQAVGPQGVSAGLDLLEERLDLGDVLRGLLVVAHLHGAAPVLLRFGAAHDDALDALGLVGLARAEDRDVHPSAPAPDRHGEVRRHVLYGDPVLVEQRSGDPLPDQFLGRLLDLLRVRNEVEDEPVADDIGRGRCVRRCNRLADGGRLAGRSSLTRPGRGPTAHVRRCSSMGDRFQLRQGRWLGRLGANRTQAGLTWATAARLSVAQQ